MLSGSILVIRPEHILCASGVTAAISQLMYVICDEGEGVLISKVKSPSAPDSGGFKILKELSS
jgi:aspartate/methionine/tyrosine aminotransferase